MICPVAQPASAQSASSTINHMVSSSRARNPIPGSCYIPAAMAEQYIFTMQNLRKVVPPQREILRGIYLSFFPGAKIGILGLNGAGKSTVLRIMAGVDKEFTGEAYPAGGTRIGYLSQDPHLDPKKTVLENVEDGVRTVKELLKRFDELGETYPAGGTRIGYLSQDPHLDPKKTVLENVEDGVRTVKELLKRFDELGEK